MRTWSSLCVALAATVAISQAAPLLSVPTEASADSRTAAIDTIASQIKNELKTVVIDGETYPLNYGPIPYPSSLAAKIIAEEIGLMGKHTSPYSAPLVKIASDLIAKGPLNYDELYAEYAKVIALPLSLNISDEAFAEARLTFKGFNLKHVKTSQSDLLDDLELEYKQFTEICGRGHAVTVFVADYSKSSSYNDLAHPEKYTPSSEAFFCVHQITKKFVPFAIRYSDTGMIVYPFDTELDWTLAKMAVNTAELNHRSWDHYSQSHIYFEPVRVEMMRHMSDQHPVYALINHHTLQNFGNSMVAYKILLNKSTTVDLSSGWGATGSLKYTDEVYSSLSFNDDFETTVAREELELIPNYKWVKYGKLLFTAIKEFASGYVNAFYPTDADLIADGELQAWAAATSATPKVNDFPAKFDARPQLSKVLTHVIFQSSVRHHLMNSNTTWHGFAFPYSTLALWSPIPETKGTTFDLRDFSPPDALIPAITLLACENSRYLPENLTLIETYSNTPAFADHPKLKDVIASFEGKMKAIEHEIQDKESTETRPYDFILPSRLAHYIWI